MTDEHTEELLFALRDQVYRLRDALADYGRHDIACNAEFGYECRCGWDDVEDELLPQHYQNTTQPRTP